MDTYFNCSVSKLPLLIHFQLEFSTKMLQFSLNFNLFLTCKIVHIKVNYEKI